MNISLQQMYQEFCIAHRFTKEENLTNEKRICYSFEESKDYDFHDWKGKHLSTETITCKKYIWLGKKGAVDLTYTPSFKNPSKDYKLMAEMRKWYDASTGETK